MSCLIDIPAEVLTCCICSYLSIKDIINIRNTCHAFATISLQSINDEFCQMIHKFPIDNVSLYQEFRDTTVAKLNITLQNIGLLIPILFASASKITTLELSFNNRFIIQPPHSPLFNSHPI
eukprot:62418_1